MRRTLRLTKETLTELSAHELGEVAGGAITPGCPTWDYCRIPTDHCVSLLDCVSQLMDPCLTYTCACV